jgi:hypothetical protein
VIEPLVHPVGDGTVGEERRDALPARIDYLALAADIQERLLLPGETGGRQVLGGSAGAHGSIGVRAVLAAEFGVGGGDLASNIVG